MTMPEIQEELKDKVTIRFLMVKDKKTGDYVPVQLLARKQAPDGSVLSEMESFVNFFHSLSDLEGLKGYQKMGVEAAPSWPFLTKCLTEFASGCDVDCDDLPTYEWKNGTFKRKAAMA